MMELSIDFDVLERPIETDARRFITFSPFQCQEHFNDVKKKVEDLFTIAEGLTSENQIQQYHMILRAQYVFMIGAFDFYMHELTKYALDQMNRNIWKSSQDFSKIEIPMGTVKEFMELSYEEYLDSFLKFITKKYSAVTMVNGEVVHDQLRMLGLETDSIYKRCYGIDSKNKKRFVDTLAELFEKRNKIAHQVDQSHMDASEYSITREDVEFCIEQLSCIVDSITREVDEKNHQKDMSREFLVLNYSDTLFESDFSQFKKEYRRFDNAHGGNSEVVIPLLGELTEDDLTAVHHISESSRRKVLLITEFDKTKPMMFSISSIDFFEEEYSNSQIESELIPFQYKELCNGKNIKLTIKGKRMDSLDINMNDLYDFDGNHINKEVFKQNNRCLIWGYLKKYNE